MKFWQIYKITHQATGKAYVGMTENLPSRLCAHRHVEAQWTRGPHSVDVLACCWTKDGAGITEALMIAEHNTLAPFGFNRMSGGFKGYKHHILTRKKISDRKIEAGTYPPPYERTPEMRARHSEAVKAAWARRGHPNAGVARSEASKAKQRAAMKGRPGPWLGKKMPAEARKNMSLGKKAYFARMRADDPDFVMPAHSPENRAKAAASWKKNRCIEKANGTLKQRKPHSDETKAKMRASAIAARARMTKDAKVSAGLKSWTTKLAKANAQDEKR